MDDNGRSRISSDDKLNKVLLILIYEINEKLFHGFSVQHIPGTSVQHSWIPLSLLSLYKKGKRNFTFIFFSRYLGFLLTGDRPSTQFSHRERVPGTWYRYQSYQENVFIEY